MRGVGKGEQVWKQAIVAIPRRAPRHLVMGPCVSTQWPTVTSCGRGRPALLRATGGRLKLGFCFRRRLSFKAGYKQIPDLSTHSPLIVVEAQEQSGVGAERGTRWCQSQGHPWCAGVEWVM